MMRHQWSSLEASVVDEDTNGLMGKARAPCWKRSVRLVPTAPGRPVRGVGDGVHRRG